MSALLNSTINKLRAEAETMRIELAKVDASIEQLVKIQGGAVAAIKRRGRQPKGNGIELTPHSNSAAAKDATLATYTSS